MGHTSGQGPIASPLVSVGMAVVMLLVVVEVGVGALVVTIVVLEVVIDGDGGRSGVGGLACCPGGKSVAAVAGGGDLRRCDVLGCSRRP